MIGLDNRNGHQAILQVEDVERLQRAYDAGTPRAAIAEAFGINVRSVYRYARARIVWAEVAGWRLPFIVWRPWERPKLLDARTPNRKLRAPDATRR